MGNFTHNVLTLRTLASGQSGEAGTFVTIEVDLNVHSRFNDLL